MFLMIENFVCEKILNEIAGVLEVKNYKEF
jgi:hypothetical protein